MIYMCRSLKFLIQKVSFCYFSFLSSNKASMTCIRHRSSATELLLFSRCTNRAYEKLPLTQEESERIFLKNPVSIYFTGTEIQIFSGNFSRSNRPKLGNTEKNELHTPRGYSTTSKATVSKVKSNRMLSLLLAS